MDLWDEADALGRAGGSLDAGGLETDASALDGSTEGAVRSLDAAGVPSLGATAAELGAEARASVSDRIESLFGDWQAPNQNVFRARHRNRGGSADRITLLDPRQKPGARKVNVGVAHRMVDAGAPGAE